MKATELRIGNWYQSVKFNTPVVCTLPDLYDLCAKSDGAYADPPIDEMFEAIPINEEWLRKFGFEIIQQSMFVHAKKSYTHVAVKCEIDLQYLDTNMWGWIEGNTIVHLYNVHQLQNLYFSLTGEELSIKSE